VPSLQAAVVNPITARKAIIPIILSVFFTENLLKVHI
jgi:hypothetical protein